MSLIDRLSGTEAPRIPAHQFYAGLTAFADGQVTRGQIETLFTIAATGADKSELDALIAGYQAATDKLRWPNALHCVFMLLERPGATMTKTQISDWLEAAGG